LKTSPSINTGFELEYIFAYFSIFLIPEPSSSAQPISLKTPAITGFFGNGVKLIMLISPYPCALLLFSVVTVFFLIISFAGKAFEYSL
jgi:hypothetical protein